MRKPINVLSYLLGLLIGSYALNNHNVIALIVSIGLFFHAFMSKDTIKESGDN